MTLDEYQEGARRTARQDLDPEVRLLEAAMGLAEEAGEVLALLRRQAFHQRPASQERLCEELGDALWCLAIAADSAGLSLGTVARSNLDKLRNRHASLGQSK
jgi:NTP pyrophosphatase (non-canonical NTP hydrolase)